MNQNFTNTFKIHKKHFCTNYFQDSYYQLTHLPKSITQSTTIMIELSKIILLFNLRDVEKKRMRKPVFREAWFESNVTACTWCAIVAHRDACTTWWRSPLRFMIYDAEALLLASLLLILLFSSGSFLNIFTL